MTQPVRAERQTGITGTASYLVAQMAKAHRKRAATLLDEVGLHLGQEFMLEALWTEGSFTQSELAARMGVRNATMTVALRSMERAGLIERTRDPDDQRVVHVKATGKSRELQPRVYDVWRRLDAQTVAGLSSDERATLKRLLARVRDNLVEDG